MKIDEAIRSADLNLAEFIPDYIARIQRKYGVTVNVNDRIGLCNTDYNYHISLAEYLYHNNAFCKSVKKNHRCFQCCSEKKKVLDAKVAQKHEAYYGRCYMGMEELVFPFYHKGILLGYLCVGEFSRNIQESRSYVLKQAEKFGMDAEDILRHFDSVVIDPNTIDMESLSYEVKTLCFLFKMQWMNSCHSQDGHYSGSDSIIHTAIQLINRDFYRQITLKELADAAYCSPDYLCRLFKKRIGMGITDYINQVRVRRACYYMDVSDLNLTRIAQECGFGQASYFAKVFKAHMGQTPSEYRSRK